MAPHNSPQVRFPEYDHVIEAFPAQGPNDSLHVRILPGTVRRNDHLLIRESSRRIVSIMAEQCRAPRRGK